jgi:hypothetical protein
MNFENYIPTNFDHDKMNAFKFLYLYRRKQAILVDLLKVCDLTNLEDLQNKKPFIRSYQYIQQETGMSDEELSESISIGLWIDEYITLSQMSEEEFIKATSELESDYDIPEDLTEDLRELHDQISEMLQHKNQDKEIFEEIVNENFNSKEEWPNGFPPYS